jgi:hypothetical protein
MIYYNYCLPVFDNIFLIATKIPRYDSDLAESVINWPPGSERNICGSTTKVF